MSNEEKVLDKLLIFMKDEISKQGKQLDHLMFNFKPSSTLHYFHTPTTTFPDGDDLIEFKKILHPKKHNLILAALNKAITEGLIKDRLNEKYVAMRLTEQGLARAKSSEANEKMKWKIRTDYFFDKVCVPLIVAIAVTLIANYLSQKDTNEEIKSLKKEIEWIKEQL